MCLVKFFKSKVLRSSATVSMFLLHGLEDLQGSDSVLAILLVTSMQVKLEGNSFVKQAWTNIIVFKEFK